MSQQKPQQDRDQMIDEWMRSNDAFKSLARQYGKGGTPALPEAVDGREGAEFARAEPPRAPGHGELDAKQEALLDWLGENEAFKRLAKQYGRAYPKPEPKR